MERPSALRLLVLRHADAERGPARDFDRKLTDRGRSQATAMGARMESAGIRPDVIVSSPAARAMETSRAAAAAWGHDVVPEESIYDASLEALLKVLAKHGGSSRTLLIVGHNPGMSELVAWLCAMPPAWTMEKGSVADLRLRASWTSLVRGCGRLAEVMDP